MRKGTTTEVRHAKKRLRRHEMYEERLSEQLERRQQQEKEHRERAVRRRMPRARSGYARGTDAHSHIHTHSTAQDEAPRGPESAHPARQGF